MTTAAPPTQISVNERNFRPQTLGDFIGQRQLKQTMQLMLYSAKTRKATLEHVAFFGGPGLGKTTLAAIIAHEANSRLHEIAAPSIGRPGDLASALTMLQPNDILFLDEIHALKRDSAETLYSAMEDFKVSIKLSKDSDPITMKVHPFTLIGSTTDFGLLPGPMRARFGHSFHLQPYTLDELFKLLSGPLGNWVSLQKKRLYRPLQDALAERRALLFVCCAAVLMLLFPQMRISSTLNWLKPPCRYSAWTRLVSKKQIVNI